MSNHNFKNLLHDELFTVLITDDEYCLMNYEQLRQKIEDVEQSWEGTTTAKGRTLEDLTVYLLSCVKPFQVTYDERTPMNQLDGFVEILSYNGHNPFLQEIGQYFLAECKNENSPVDINHVSKVQNIIHKHRMNVGLIFSRKHLTGAGKFEDAQAEVLSLFRGEGKRILVITFAELKAICLNKVNFLTFLREKDKNLRLFKIETNKLETEIRKYGKLKKEGLITKEEFDSIKISLREAYAL